MDRNISLAGCVDKEGMRERVFKCWNVPIPAKPTPAAPAAVSANSSSAPPAPTHEGRYEKTAWGHSIVRTVENSDWGAAPTPEPSSASVPPPPATSSWQRDPGSTWQNNVPRSAPKPNPAKRFATDLPDPDDYWAGHPAKSAPKANAPKPAPAAAPTLAGGAPADRPKPKAAGRGASMIQPAWKTKLEEEARKKAQEKPPQIPPQKSSSGLRKIEK